MEQDFGAIILGGGTSSRMRLESDIPKQLLPIYNNKSLLQYQIEWLKGYGIQNIVIAIDLYSYNYIIEHMPYLTEMAWVSVETEKLGTGGAILKSTLMLNCKEVYVMNVDDFVLSEVYSPDELIDTIKSGFSASILTSRGRFPYGVLKSRGRRVTRFDQKPIMELKVSTGHYAFQSSMIEQKFPSTGDFESTLLPQLVRDKELTFLDLDGTWITANTWKEIIEARKKIEVFEHRKLYGTEHISSNRRGFKGYGIR